jgi:nucleotidyltransferase substrate binding protein (TIGR01987 family)
VIHRFKVTYDLSHKILKTYLGVISENPKQINQMAFQNWITLAHESGIILNDWPMWQRYRDQRSRTLYSFDLTIANNVLSTISDFIKEVEFFTLNVSGHLKR